MPVMTKVTAIPGLASDELGTLSFGTSGARHRVSAADALATEVKNKLLQYGIELPTELIAGVLRLDRAGFNIPIIARELGEDSTDRVSQILSSAAHCAPNGRIPRITPPVASHGAPYLK